MADFFGELLVFLVSLLFVWFFSNILKTPKKYSFLLFFWHTFFCLAYWQYTLFASADAFGYFNKALEADSLSFNPGNDFVVSCVLILQTLGLSYLACFLVYQLTGFLGLLLFVKIFQDNSFKGSLIAKRVSSVVIWLPGLSFWTVAIGKDGTSFLGVCLAVYAALYIQKRILIFIFGIFLMFMVRPHVGAIMVIAACAAIFLDKNTKLTVRVILFLVACGATIAIVPFVMGYVGLEGVSTKDIKDYTELRQGYNLEGGSSVDIAQLPLIAQLFTYMFRPLFFDAPGISGIVVSFENLFLLFVFIGSCSKILQLIRSNKSFFVRFNVLYTVVAWLVLATTTANLGISIRQKTMILPSLIVLMILALSKKKRNVR